MKIKKKKVSIARTTILFVIMFLVSSIIFIRLLYLQVVNGDMYKERADTTYVRTLSDPAPRGKILDRNGVVLASNEISYSVVYNQTAETKKVFYPTIDEVMNILLKNKEKLKDDFKIKYNDKTNSYRFDFITNDQNAKKSQELRFKKDNGMEDKAIEDLSEEFKDRGEVFKKISKEEQATLIENKLLEYSAKDTYEYVRDELLEISYESFFLKLCDLYKNVDKNKSIEYFAKYFNYDASTESFERIMSKFKGSEYPRSDDIKALIETLGLKDKKFIKEKERAYVIIGAAMRLQLFSGFSPIVISNDIKKNTADIINQCVSDMPGIDITTEPVRFYPFGTLASNIIGYLGSISAESSEDYRLKGYDVSKDFVGISGIESAFEDELRGNTGGKIVKLSEDGRVASTLGSLEASEGKDVQLTIDKDVQYVVENALQAVMTRLQDQPVFEDANTKNATRGAAVMIDIKAWEIIAAASSAGFDPNDFAAPGKLTDEKYNYYYDDKKNTQEFYDNFVNKTGLSKSYDELFPIENGKRVDKYDLMPKPFFNYATMTLASPGSTFKPITAVAGLSEGIITPEQTIHDDVIYKRYPGTENQFRDWNAYSLGNVNVTRALEISNNYFFFTVGDWLKDQKGFNKLAEYAWMFGLGADPTDKKSYNSTGVEIEEEYFGPTYNEFSYRNTYMDLFMESIHEHILLDNNINLEETEEDLIEIKDIKNELNKEIKDQIRKDTIEENKGNIYDLLRDLAIKQNIPDENLEYGYINLINRMYEKVEESRYPGNVLNASIGQGMSQYTPLQLAVYMATLANQGERKTAHFVKNIIDSNDNIVKSFPSETLSKLDIDPGHYAAILEGLKRVNYGADGTVGEGVLDDFPIKIAGKTGSATYAQDVEEKYGRTSYAVYAGFAPADDPEVAFSVVIFDGGHGGAVVPVVLRMLEAYYKDELKAQEYTPKHNLIGYEEIDINSFIDEIYRK